jgi:hypothetical protein
VNRHSEAAFSAGVISMVGIPANQYNDFVRGWHPCQPICPWLASLPTNCPCISMVGIPANQYNDCRKSGCSKVPCTAEHATLFTAQAENKDLPKANLNDK